jgi:hypothetical protein
MELLRHSIMAVAVKKLKAFPYFTCLYGNISLCHRQHVADVLQVEITGEQDVCHPKWCTGLSRLADT